MRPGRLYGAMLTVVMATVALVVVPAAVASASLPPALRPAPDGHAQESTGGVAGHHRAADGTSVAVCPSVVAPGQATCLARRRTDSAATSAVPVRPGGLAPDTSTSSTVGDNGAYDPSYLQSAYNLPSSTGGVGQTVAIVDAYDDPSAAANLSSYRSYFGLPACTSASGCFRKVNEHGGTTYPTANASWSQEISLDLDMVSAICPNCHILLVEASSTSIADLGTGVNEAVALGANVVSNSYGGPEYAGESADNTKYYDHPGVAITVAAGDEGYGAQFPSTSPTVTSVGGTSLVQATNSGTRNATETVWSGSGSGCSAYEVKPIWQTDSGCLTRMSTDVSAVADPNTGVWVYDTYGGGTWSVFGGTSVATPIIGAAYALADNGPSTSPMNSLPYADSGALNDVTSGSNGSCTLVYFCTGEVGYDGPSGLGTPSGVAAFTLGSAAVVPSAPTNLVATGASGSVNLTWSTPSNDGGSPITGYDLYRSTSSGTETLLAHLGVTTAYSDTAVTSGTTYYYEVTAVNAVGGSLISAEASAASTSVPSAPTNLLATAAVGSVNLTWTAPSSSGGSPITAYNVYRGTSSGTETLLSQLGVTASYSDTAVTAGTTYYYEVTAVNGVGEGPVSSEAVATQAAATSVPSTPANLVATAVVGAVTLTWSTPSTNGGSPITGYDVYRGTSSGTETLLAQLGVTTAYSDAAVTDGTTYYYEVTALNGVGGSPASTEVAATPEAAPTVPGAPRSLAAHMASGKGVTLTWKAPASNGGSSVSSYSVYRSTRSGHETLHVTVTCASSACSYTDDATVSGTTYYYDVAASNSVGTGPVSNQASTTTR